MLRIESSLPEDLDHLIERVIGAGIEVHRRLGPGFIEKIYERALCHEFSLLGISYERQKEILVPYRDILIPGQQLDLLVEGRLILELKAVDSIHPIHEAQLISYLKALELRAGLIFNFKASQLRYGIKRIVL